MMREIFRKAPFRASIGLFAAREAFFVLDQAKNLCGKGAKRVRVFQKKKPILFTLLQ